MAYAEENLLRPEKKQVREASKAVVWGCEIESGRRTARSAPGKLCQAIGVTLATIAEGWCAGRVL